MVSPRPIEVVKVRGSHREVGRQIGEACAKVIRHSARGFDDPAKLERAARCREITSATIPWVVEEHDGAAEAAGVDPLVLFSASLEDSFVELAAGTPNVLRGRCSDLVAAPPASANGHLLVAHNNDLYERNEEQLVAIEREVPGDPRVFTIGIGPWPSVGWNSAGISFTGNELTPNDTKIGIPVILQFRAMLSQQTTDAAVGLALHHERASSYNNLIADRNGGVVNIEGSATEAELTEPDDDGLLAHTNHYACERMLPREGDPEYAKRSAVRLRRAIELLEEARGSMTEGSLRAMLSDHENNPDSLCRHPASADEPKTVFWCIADVTDMRITYGRGNPCLSEAPVQQYGF